MRVPKLNRVGIIAALVGGVVVVTLGGVVMARMQGEDLPDGALATFEARRGPLPITVNVSGTIMAQDQVVLKSEVEGQVSVLWIIEEGREVEEGELLVQLDASALEDEVVEDEIGVKNAQAALVSAEEGFEVTKNQAEADVDKADLDFELAKLDLQKFVEGEYPAQLKEAEAQVTLALGNQKRADDTLNGSERLAERDFITTTELEADRQSALKAQLDVELARESMKVLTEFTYHRTMAELNSAVSQAEMALERIKRKAKADVAQAQADLEARRLQHQREEQRLEETREQLAATKIYAPTPGTVVYATSGGDSWRGRDEPLEEGVAVRERQELIYLPTSNAFKAKVDVHETSLSKLQRGQKARVTVDALPGREFYGYVTYIAPMPDAQSRWMNPDLKIYSTEITLQGDMKEVRSGSSCKAEIEIEEYKDAVYVPIQCVVRVGGEPTVYLPDGSTRRVEIGLDNNRMIRIVDGLAQGEKVLLNPPLSEDLELGDEDYVSLSDKLEPWEDPSGGNQRPPQGAEGGGGDAQGQSPRGDDAGGQGGAPGGGQSMEDMRQRYENMSDEEKEQARKQWEERMQNMSPEDRERMMQRMREGGGRGGGSGRGPRGDETGGGSRGDGDRGERRGGPDSGAGAGAESGAGAGASDGDAASSAE